MQLTDATRAIAAAADANISIVGFAFVNSSVTAQGRRAEPPARNENLSARLKDYRNRRMSDHALSQ
jgi:hypothetical protein